MLEAQGEANCFAKTLALNKEIIDGAANELTAIFYAQATFYWGLIIVEVTAETLKSLDEDSALGFDMLPSRIRKGCAHVLAPVFHTLIFGILTLGEWQAFWMNIGSYFCINANVFAKLGITEVSTSLRK